jgi:uncharacterized membrane protein YccC
MAGAFSPLPLRSWLQRKPDWLDHQTVAALIFALKTFAAAILALFIAFWAGLDEPRWAFLTVFVVAQPNGGLVLAKSFYRILGTIAGVLVTIALVFGLAQYGELFVAALALWMGFCNFAARAARNFASYGFQLAGYTVAIAGLPAALVPAGAYPLLVGRFTEISLGILCAALVSRLVAAQELLPKLVEQVRSLTRRADRFAALLLDRDADRERVAAERIELTKDYLQIEAMQSSAYFESAEARILNQPLRRLTQAAVNLCAMAEAAASHRDGSPPDPGKSASAGAVLHARESWPEASAQISALVRAADERDIDSARVRLRQSMAAFDRGDELPESKIACRFWSDPVPALLAGMRTALAVGITATIWFAIAWPDGPTAVVVAGVLCMLGASMAQPIKITLALAATILISAVPVYATWFYLMPLAVDFPSLAAALAPLSLICAFIIAQPKIGATGLLVIVYFEFASKIDNVQAYNAAAFLNSSFAILVGMAVTLVLFATFFPETPAYAARRFRRQLLVHLSGLVGARWRPAARLQCYRQALFERLGATLATVGDEPKAASECVVAALTALSAAQAIGRLRDALAPAILPPAIARQGFQLLTRLSRTLRHPSVCKFSESEEEARLLARHALAAARDSAEAEKIQALSGIVVACETLGSDLLRGRMLLEEKANARRA